MRFLLEDASKLKDILGVLKDFCNAVTFVCNNEGLSMQAMDSSHVAMSGLTMKKTQFKEYDMGGESEVRISTSVENLAKLLRLAGPGTTLLWDTRGKTDRLSLELACTKSKTNYKFDLLLMDIESDELEIPELQFTNVVQLKSSEFKRMVHDTIDFGTVVNVKQTGTELGLHVTGDAGEFEISKDVTTVSSSDTYKGRFASRYMLLFSKADKISSEITILMSEGIPIQLKYTLGDDGSEFALFVAPQIDDDMET